MIQSFFVSWNISILVISQAFGAQGWNPGFSQYRKLKAWLFDPLDSIIKLIYRNMIQSFFISWNILVLVISQAFGAQGWNPKFSQHRKLKAWLIGLLNSLTKHMYRSIPVSFLAFLNISIFVICQAWFASSPPGPQISKSRERAPTLWICKERYSRGSWSWLQARFDHRSFRSPEIFKWCWGK